MSLRRHILQVVALVTAVALVFGAFAGVASAKKLNKAQKAKVRAELRKSVKKNPGVVKRRSFLKKAALVNFKLPVTIRLRNPCSTTQNGTTYGGSPNPVGSVQNPGGYIPTALNCVNQGTALNQLGVPNAKINLGPSLGSREVSLSGALAAVVEFADTYDGGALGNVNIKILPGSKTLRTSSVPLLWNTDIAGGTGTRADANFAKSALGLINSPSNTYSAANTGERDAFNQFATTAEPGCDNWTSTVGGGPGTANYIATGGTIPSGYKSLFYGSGYSFLSQAGVPGGPYTQAGAPGYAVYTAGGLATQKQDYFLPVYPGGDNPLNIVGGTGVTGNNDYVGTNPNPFPIGSAPVSSGGSPTNGGLYSGVNPAAYNAANTVLRTNALSLGIAAGGTSVNMGTGTQVNVGTVGGLTTAQGSNNITMGYSGGQANLFGNIPGKNVGIDVTVNLATKINAIARIMDQDVFKQNTLIAGNNWPASIFSCRQIFTGAVQNYIPGVRLTGSLRIAPAITKDGKVRIAKATVTSDASNPDRVALSACLFPSKPYNDYTTGSSDASNKKLPANVDVVRAPGGPNEGAGTDFYGNSTSTILGEGNISAPLKDAERYPPTTNTGSTGPDQVPCGSDGTGNNGITPFASDYLASIIRDSSLTKTVSGLPGPTDPAFTGYEVTANGGQASVAGDITVGKVDVDVLLGDQPIGS